MLSHTIATTSSSLPTLALGLALDRQTLSMLIVNPRIPEISQISGNELME